MLMLLMLLVLVLMLMLRRAELGEVVILDADNNKVETPFADLESLPGEVQTSRPTSSYFLLQLLLLVILQVLSNLRRSLKPGTGLLGDSVARAFLQALVHLIGGYRDALRYGSCGDSDHPALTQVPSRREDNFF